MKPVCLTIAGTDPLCGAGIFLDLQVFKVLETRGYSVISVVVAQNASSVFNQAAVPTQLFCDQINAILKTAEPSAIKVGLVCREHVDALVQLFRELPESVPIVCDPVLGSSSGFSLNEPEALYPLFPHMSLITPNIPEAEILSGKRIRSRSDLYEAGGVLLKKSDGAPVLVKGGHLAKPGSDYLFTTRGVSEITTNHVDTGYSVRGTGCLLSSAITSYMAQGVALEDAVCSAKRFLEAQLGAVVPVNEKTAMFSLQ
jgi:hydroxymethylpyrimidine/phosphomethylpyrimidine kinase